MSAADDVPRAEDIFLKRRSAPRRQAGPGQRGAMLPLFESLEFTSVPADEKIPAQPTAAVSASPIAIAPKQKESPGVAAAAPRVWTVAELVRSVRGVVEASFSRITIDGEISNWRPAASGHCYFTLKDGEAQVNVVMFRREAALVRFTPRDGDAVRLRGQVTLYEARGQMQVIAESMELAGVGAQLAAVQALKERLKREGLFDRRRPLPAFPRCIGVVTSLQGAALRDIVKVCRRRHAAVNLLVYPAAVQGDRCAAEIAAGVAWFSTHAQHADVVVVARGGGSWEDLHGFDDERVVRAIAACRIPVVVGVGHATDSVLADAAADICAPTPSAAAELVTAAQHRVEERVLRAEARLHRAGRFEILRQRQRMFSLAAEAALRRVQDEVGRCAQRVDELEFRTQSAVEQRGRREAALLRALDQRLARQSVAVRVALDRSRLERNHGRLQTAALQRLAAERNRVGAAELRAQSLSPLRVLERGYALVYGPRGNLLRSAAEVVAYDSISARLSIGKVQARVERTELPGNETNV